MNFILDKYIIPPRVRKLKDGCKIYVGDVVKDLKGNVLSRLRSIKKNSIVQVIDCWGRERKVKCESRKHKFCRARDCNDRCYTYSLEYDKDDRHCWTCTNTEAISEKIIAFLKNPISKKEIM